MPMTFAEALAVNGISVPDDGLADLEIPVLTGPQRQGDVGVFPRAEPLTAGERQIAKPINIGQSVSVVRGEAGAHTHWLNVDGPAFWLPKDSGVLLGVLEVPEGTTAYLTHDDEHGANGIGPGTYALHGKREQAEEIRRVQD